MSEQDPYLLTAKAYNAMAQAYQDKFMDLNLYNHTYDLFCDLMVGPGKIFEIGCGPGNITRYLTEKRTDLEIEAIDVAPNMIRLAIANVPKARFRIMDCRNIDTIQTRFHGIVCGFCLPYLNRIDSEKLLNNCFTLLLPGGLLYFSTIEGSYESSGMLSSSNGEFTTLVHYYSENDLLDFIGKNGFELIKLLSVKYPKAEGIENHLIVIARKPESSSKTRK